MNRRELLLGATSLLGAAALAPVAPLVAQTDWKQLLARGYAETKAAIDYNLYGYQFGIQELQSLYANSGSIVWKDQV